MITGNQTYFMVESNTLIHLISDTINIIPKWKRFFKISQALFMRDLALGFLRLLYM